MGCLGKAKNNNDTITSPCIKTVVCCLVIPWSGLGGASVLAVLLWSRVGCIVEVGPTRDQNNTANEIPRQYNQQKTTVIQSTKDYRNTAK